MGKGLSGMENSQGVNAMFDSPFQIVYSSRENSFFIADMGNHMIRKVTMDGKEHALWQKQLDIHI